MKNLVTLFFVFFIISSCQKLETNSPAFQASVEDVFFKADQAEANYFQNDDFFSPINLIDNSGYTVTVNGYAECLNYVEGGYYRNVNNIFNNT